MKITVGAKYLYTNFYPMRTYPNKLSEVDLLTSKLLDDNFTEEELYRLTNLLRESKSARTRYSELTIQDSLLHWESVDYVETANEWNDRSSIITFPVISSIAAAIIALFGVWWFHTTDVNPSLDAQEVALNAFETIPEKSNFSENTTFPISTTDQTYPVDSLTALNIPFNSQLARSSIARDNAAYGIEILRKNKSFGVGGVVEFNNEITSWKRTEHLSVPAENGILPIEGEDMIKFSSMNVDVHSQVAEISETLQILDVREVSQEDNDLTTYLQTSLFFNKGVGLAGDSTEFALSFHAIASDANNENTSIGYQDYLLESDVNPSTWEELKKDFVLPSGTEFVIVSMSAKKEGPSALLPDNGGHYADGLTINLLIDRKNTIGPL